MVWRVALMLTMHMLMQTLMLMLARLWRYAHILTYHIPSSRAQRSERNVAARTGKSGAGLTIPRTTTDHYFRPWGV